MAPEPPPRCSSGGSPDTAPDTSSTRRGYLAAVGATATVLAGCVASPAGSGDAAGADGLAEEATAQFRVNLGRHGYREVTAPDAVERDWTLDDVNPGEHTAAKASAVPTPSGDVVLAGDSGLVYRVSPDGEVRWRAATDPSVRGIHGTPAVANGTVYVGAYEGTLYAFDLETGIREWKANLGDAIGSSPLYHRGRVFIAVEYYTPSGSLFAVDAASGDVAWEDDRITDHPHSSPAIDEATGTLVVGSNDGYLYAWDYPALEFAWRFETGAAIKGPVATYDGAAFVGSWDHHVYRVDLESGEEEWAFEADDMVMSGPGVDTARDTVYVGSHDDNLYAVDADTGEAEWTFGTDGWLIGCPAVTEGSVLVGSYDGNCYCVEKTNGEERWRAAGNGWVTSTPLVHDGAVYFTDRATGERAGSLYRYTGA